MSTMRSTASQPPVLDVLRNRSWALLGVAVGAALLAYLMTMAMRPAYRAEVLLSPVSDDSQSSLLAALGGQLGGLGGLVGAGLGADSQASERIAMLTSRALASQFIAENHVGDRFCDAEVIDCGRPRVAGAEPSERETNDALRLFLQRVLTVSEDKRSGLVRVSIIWFDRHLAAEWANRYVALANREIQRRAIEESKRRIEFLHQAASDAREVQLRDATYRLIEAEIKSVMVATTRPDFAFRVIDAALVPDDRAPVRPKRSVLALAGGFLGGLLALFVFWILAGQQGGKGTEGLPRTGSE